MRKHEIECGNCEAEFYIEHEGLKEEISFCPFCGDEFTEIEHEEPDLEEIFEDV